MPVEGTSLHSERDPDAIATVRAMLAAWDALDWDAVVELFAADAVFHPMPRAPIVGCDAIRARINAFGALTSYMECRISLIGAVSHIIATERIDSFTLRGETVVQPCAGFFEVVAGKIAVWREYYDGSAVARLMSAESSATDR